MTEPEGNKYDFDIAVSFAGENRDYVEEVVGALKGDMRVFYDGDYEAEAWGQDGTEYFTNVYMNRAKYAIVFVSQQYADKMWTKIERRSALARAAAQRSAYLLPVRLDDTQLDGLLPTVIYLDSRRLGIEGLIAAIRTKVSGTALAKPARSLLDGKVPRSQEAIEALMTERTGWWEYLLYGGLLKLNMDKLESKYQDFSIGFARRNGQHVKSGDTLDFVQSAIGSMNAIVNSFEVVLDAGVQERAFGKPGEPGDVDRIVHMAETFISVYEDFMDWATELRGTSARTGAASESLRLLALWAEQPVEECRDFVARFVAELDTAEERSNAGEQVGIEMSVTLLLDPALTEALNEKLKEVVEDEDV